MPKVAALPYDFEFDPATTAVIMIDMQRDFIEPGGFGATLGNDVSLLAAIVPTAAKVLDACRNAGMTIIHTKECHRPDLADCPPAKLLRGKPSMRIGDPGAMGRILIDGEPGSDFVPALQPKDGDIVISKPGKGAFYGTTLGEILRLYERYQAHRTEGHGDSGCIQDGGHERTDHWLLLADGCCNAGVYGLRVPVTN